MLYIITYCRKNFKCFKNQIKQMVMITHILVKYITYTLLVWSSKDISGIRENYFIRLNAEQFHVFKCRAFCYLHLQMSVNYCSRYCYNVIHDNKSDSFTFTVTGILDLIKDNIIERNIYLQRMLN